MSVLERDQESTNGMQQKNREDVEVRVTWIHGT